MIWIILQLNLQKSLLKSWKTQSDWLLFLPKEISLADTESTGLNNPALYESTESFIIAQVYRLSAVHCQMTRYSQRVPGYLTRYSVSANEISFDNKISQSDCVFQIRLGMEENYSPLHLVTSTGFLKA